MYSSCILALCILDVLLYFNLKAYFIFVKNEFNNIIYSHNIRIIHIIFKMSNNCIYNNHTQHNTNIQLLCTTTKTMPLKLPITDISNIPTNNTKLSHNIIYNYYSNNNHHHPQINSQDYCNIIKWSLYALANTAEYTKLLLDIGINAQFIRDSIIASNRLNNISLYDNFGYNQYHINMYNWISARCIFPLPENITYSDVKYYTMSSLITNHCLNLDNIRANIDTYDNSYIDITNFKFETIRAVYKSPSDNIIYSAIIALTIPILDYKFNPIDEYAIDMQYKYICLDVPTTTYESNHPNSITKIMGGILFRPLTLLYIGIDDLFNIGKDFGYQSVISYCNNSQWQSIFQ